MQIPFEALPPVPRLFLDYIRTHPKVAGFYPYPPTLETVESFARERAGLESVERIRLVSVLEAQQRRWGGPVSPVEKLQSGAVAVVTGQQAGLFTGPMLSILKGLTAVKLARELEKRGVPAVPIFWVAADDHDREEIEWAGVLNQESRFQRIRSTPEDGNGAPAAWMKYSEGIVAALEECFSSLPASDVLADVRAILADAYRPNVSPVDAFARTMLRLFEGLEMILVDPMDPPLRDLAGGLMENARNRTVDMRKAVLERTRAIREAGYVEQVRVDDTFTGLFMLSDGIRRPVNPASVDGTSPSELSPNVLLRPVVQDYLLPTAAYVGGPAEVAYFAQAGALYDALDRSMPPLYPRITATFLEPPVVRILNKYGLGFEDVLAGADRLRERAVGSASDTSIFREVEDGIRREAERLRPLLERTDRTLGGALDNSVQKLGKQIEILHSRFVAAEARRSELMERQLSLLTARLFPERKLQERAVNVTTFLARYGTPLIDLMDQRLELDGSVHQVVAL